MTARLRQSYELDPWEEGLMGDWQTLATAKGEAVEWVCHADGPLVSGTFQARSLRDGMAIHWSDLHLGGDIWMPPGEGSPWVIFEFTLKGAWENRVKSPERRDFGEVAGQMGLLHDRWPSRHVWLASDSFVHVTASMREDVLRQWLGDPNEDEPAGLSCVRKFIDQNDTAALHVPITQRAAALVHQTMHCSHIGPLRALFLEARFHDLILELIGALAEETTPDYMGSRCHPKDRERIYAAAELLVKRLDAPPDMAELSRLMGMSESTLNRGFRNIYGTTPYAYLRDRRMEHARMLLERGQATVLEASASVGYENPSNFAAAFRASFGMNPREFLTRIKSRK